MAKYEEQMDALDRKSTALVETEVRMHPNLLSSWIIFAEYLRIQGGSGELLDTVEAKRIFGQFSKTYLDSEHGENMLAAIRRLGTPKSEQPKVEIPVIGVGNTAPAFEQASLGGRSLSLADFKGKYVLLDFWASWCAPCRKVNPDLVKLYEKYKGANFEILGISLDNDRKKWQDAIKADKLIWQHVSDLKGWANEVAKQYGIRAIPQNFLIDPTGKVVAKNLKISELDKTLEELL